MARIPATIVDIQTAQSKGVRFFINKALYPEALLEDNYGEGTLGRGTAFQKCETCGTIFTGNTCPNHVPITNANVPINARHRHNRADVSTLLAALEGMRAKILNVGTSIFSPPKVQTVIDAQLTVAVAA